ncbi:hypothetical protein ACH9L7_09465 [Haloferax sp. S1W]|uniref:hypothetical protein n=1 Tax=Haloferax sp. S1W TaxID=3377110 RepID=UPI0037CA6835
MSLQTRVRSVPRFLAVEVALAVVFLVLGVVPFVLFTETELSAPPGYGRAWGVALAALGAFWVVLLAHALADVWRLLRNRGTVALDNRAGFVHGVFRVVETLSALAAPVVPFVIVDSSSDAPLPPGAGVAIALFIAAPLCIGGVVVLLHTGWMVWTGGNS